MEPLTEWGSHLQRNHSVHRSSERKKEQNSQMSLEVGITLKAHPQAIQRSIEEEKESFLFVLFEKCKDYGDMWYMVVVEGGEIPV